MGNEETMALLTRLVNELRAENAMLKSQIFTKRYEPENKIANDLEYHADAVGKCNGDGEPK